MDNSGLGMSVPGIGDAMSNSHFDSHSEKDLGGYIPPVDFKKNKTISESFRLFERFAWLLQKEHIGSTLLRSAADELVKFLEAPDSPYANEALTPDFQQAFDAAKLVLVKN